MTTSPPAAVLWDMDGTLVDTEPYWMRAETVLVESFGGSWTEENALELVGSGLWRSAEILQKHGVRLTPDEIITWLTESVRRSLVADGVPWRPGARELLAELREHGVPTALVTMSIASMAEDIVNAIGFHAFDVMVTGDSVTHAKPHPEPYLRAAEQLGVDPRACVAIEDSPAGLASARAAGVVAIGVPRVLDLSDEPAHAHWVSLAGRSVADLAALHVQHRGVVA